ncbi:PREDICTED: U-box domain-containing protein 36-like isoform X2 [Camelina sativa]|uniref:RING-type E3 ubiquitin transferase n=1 Tax=Camelina sativa TaxID=90675 RepID=A0ABM0SMI3_CAMSA|nr:PREDICTED: U-box domain-containing protein 36-like isoform X2 [Camelina sativa]
MVGDLRYHGRDIVESMETSKRETLMDEKIYVAVSGKNLEGKSSLVWAIENSGGKEFCIVHVHKPIQNSVSGAMLDDKKLRVYRKDKKKAHKKLDTFFHICRQLQVSAEIVYIEMDSVEEGILQLISQRGVRKLVMGAAGDRHYSMKMRDLQSKKAIYINREAPATCQIWFTCNGYLISSREARRTENLYLECASSTNSLIQSEVTRGSESVPRSSIVRDDDLIKVAVTEAETSKRKARFEASKRDEAEKSAIDALKKAKQWETAYFEEMKRRKETEKVLRKAKEEIEKMRSESEIQIAESNMVIRKLQDKYSLSVEALRILRKEQEELKIELREVTKLREEEKVSPSNHREPPQYFICPITQDIMEDPHVAADGFTYEGEAISGWFERGHETSPMINKRLSHTSLVPNLALRSAIQEWLQVPESLNRPSSCKDISD